MQVVYESPIVDGSTPIVADATLGGGASATILPNYFVNAVNVLLSWGIVANNNATTLTIVGVGADGNIITESKTCPVNASSPTVDSATVNKYLYIISITNAGLPPLSAFSARAVGQHYTADADVFVEKSPLIVLDTTGADAFEIQFTPLPIVVRDDTKVLAGTTFSGCTSYKAVGTIQDVYNTPTFSGSVTGPFTLTPASDLAWPNTVTGAESNGDLAIRAGTVYGTVYARPLSAIKVYTKKLFGKLVIDIVPYGAF